MSETIFTCPMHPEVQARAPGSCPKCGMKLEPKGPVRRDMRWRSSAFAWPFWFAIAVAACGGSQPPAESPEQTPSSPGPSTDADEADAAPEGEHTMPDGTTMPGDHHEHDSSSPATDETTE